MRFHRAHECKNTSTNNYSELEIKKKSVSNQKQYKFGLSARANCTAQL